MPWIWLTQGIPTNEDAGLRELRIESMKARARYRHLDEEVHFLKEEMRRVLTFLKWEAEWWDQRAVLRRIEKAEHTEAFTAYAKRQAAIRQKLSASMANWDRVGKMVTQGFGVADETAKTDEIEMSTIDAPPCKYLEDEGEQDEVKAGD
ncbi:hypothetical protein J3R83DRAFT_10715 [Lanmaoa asiatica]|nr:hypothetical protein J3R83DRAFT_10715 [Lanmaoa asiatica]